MFFGKILKEGQTHKFELNEGAEYQSKILTITNVVLAPTSNSGASLWFKRNDEEFLIANLTKNQPHLTLNIIITLID